MEFKSELDLIDLNAIKADAVKIFFTVPRIVYFTEEGNFINIIKELSQETSIKEGSNKVFFGIAQAIGINETRAQMPIEVLSSSMLTYASAGTTRGQIVISSIITPDGLIKSIEAADNKFISLNDELKEVILDILGGAKNNISLGITNVSEVPFGMILEFYNKSSTSPIARVFLEMCKVASYTYNTSAGSPIVLDSMTILFHRAIDF